MGALVPFTPRAELEAEANLRDFILLCRDRLIIFGPVDWNGDAWDITDTLRRKGRKGRIALVWSNHDTSKHVQGAQLRQPFLDFARAYLRYQHAVKPTTDVLGRLAALRGMERALTLRLGTPRIHEATVGDFQLAAMLLSEKFVPDRAYRLGAQLEMLLAFLTDMHCLARPIAWRNPIKRPKVQNNRVGEEAAKNREERLPTETALEALGKAFSIASEPVDRVVTAAGALLCSAPDRVSEVLILPVDCEHRDRRADGKEAYGLRWRPSKGAKPYIKWIVASMADTVKDAIERLRQTSAEARRIAIWYEENPDKVFLPETFSYLRESTWISLDELRDLLGLASRGQTRQWANRRKLQVRVVDGVPSVSFGDFEDFVLQELPTDFPYLDRDSDLTYGRALFIVRKNELRPEGVASAVMIEAISIDQINNGLGAARRHGKSSVFSRLDFKELDGSEIVLTTHMFRHWLNTVGQRQGLSQLDIAKWSGRKDIRQNETYDHMTSEELLARTREVGGDVLFGPIAEFSANPPVSRSEFLKLSFPTAHSTELGFCIHDFVQLPCQRNADCANCTEHVCVKGDSAKTERIRRVLADIGEQLRRAEAAMVDGRCGADRWVEHQRMTFERLTQLLAILDDPAIPNGAVIQLANVNEFSSVRNAMDQRRQLGDEDGRCLTWVLTLDHTELASA